MNNDTQNTAPALPKRGRGRPAIYGWNVLVAPGDSITISNPKTCVPSSAFAWAKRHGFKISTTSIIENGMRSLKVSRLP